MKDERIIHSEILERIEADPHNLCSDAGNKTLRVKVQYEREARRKRPRGYYLTLQVFLATDAHSEITAMSFGDEGDPYESVLLEETKAFSQKKFDALVVPPETLLYQLAKIKETYCRRRERQLLRLRDQQARREALATA